MRVLVFVTDAFGGRGGIAKFNRDLLGALCDHPACTEVVALPRVVLEEPCALPDKLSFRVESSGSKINYIRQAVRAIAEDRFELVICGHLNLISISALAAWRHRAPLLLIIHGIEAWKPPRSSLAQRLVRQADALVSVSEFTRQRFVACAGLHPGQGHVIPNCIDVSHFGPGQKRSDLLARYGLAGRTVVLTVGRLSSAERYKGVDEVLELLPELAREVPSLSYLIVGDGDDRRRLEAKAAALGVRERVIFAGYVPEQEKADHYRLADAFVMPGRGEGFGIVYLEALACGVPVVASNADASQEAVREGALGQVVDPDRPEEIRAAILRALAQPERRVPEGLDHFSTDRFRERWHRLLNEVLRPPTPTLELEEFVP